MPRARLAAPVKEPPGEFELISRLCAKLPHTRRTILGPGDDCAILAPSRRAQLFTIDSMVEGVHFKLEWGTRVMLGGRALTVNLSDIAAMGGRPTVCVVNLAIRPGLTAEFFDELYQGLRSKASESGVEVVGGNITRASELAITVALLGEVETEAMRRDSARPGDKVYVSGTVGDAALGLRLLQGKVKAERGAGEFLINRFLNPTARIAAGKRLARITPLPAAIDISDGLWQDLGHILERSGVGAQIDGRAIPLSPAYRRIMGDDPELALSGGDDYELLFCTSAQLSEARLSQRLGVQVHCIGEITRHKRATLTDSSSRPTMAPAQGWDQLRARA
jgi:thiamine-monophosphate kinase